MEAKALGKGLSALIPEKSGQQTDGSVTFLNANEIKNNKLQPRVDYDEAKLKELTASIKEKGVLQPILVRKLQDGYEVVAGERRLRAAKALGVENIPVIVKELTDQETLVVALVENIQREELNPIEEAKAYERLIKEFHYTQETVAQSVGKDRTTITNILRLLKLSGEIQNGVIKGSISQGHARTLLSLESSAEQKQFFDLCVKKGLSVRELEGAVRSGVKPSTRREKEKKPKSPEVKRFEELLQEALGTKVSVEAKKDRGKIIIEYYSMRDLGRIVEKLKG